MVSRWTLRRSLFASFVVANTLLVQGCTSHDVDIVLMLDSSGSSSQYREQQVRVVKQFINHLNPGQNSISLYRISERVEALYAGSASNKSITPVLDAYHRLDGSEYGSAYGIALREGIRELERRQATRTSAGKSWKGALILMGDAADEPLRHLPKAKTQMTDELLATTGKTFPADGMLAFLFAEPEYGTRLKNALEGSLGPRFLYAPPPNSTQFSTLKQIFDFVQR